MLTPYTPGPAKNGYGCTNINSTNKARDKSSDVQWRHTVAQGTESLEERPAYFSQNNITNKTERDVHPATEKLKRRKTGSKDYDYDEVGAYLGLNRHYQSANAHDHNDRRENT